MLPANTCPKCDQTAPHMLVQPMEGKVQVENGKSVLCPNCHAVLGAQVDPIAIMGDTINQVVARLTPRP